MAKIAFIERKFSRASAAIIECAERILDEYAAQGYRMTLRQLYYRFVATDVLPNTARSYKRLGSIVNDARLAGLLDWAHLEDRTREPVIPGHWASPAEIVKTAAQTFAIDKWSDQPWHVEVWIEKEALAGVFEPVCAGLDVTFLADRGYLSQSAMFEAACRFAEIAKAGRKGVVLYCGDHDPSGLDMIRDVQDRFVTFLGGRAPEVVHVALTRKQIEKYSPPPNPAKETDSRYSGYADKHGDESFELDALEPRVLGRLIRKTVARYRDDAAFEAQRQIEDRGREQLERVAVALQGGEFGE